ncbi:MAG: sensor domain-containing diguanylate cyclase [Actinomycetota bacterium]
MTENQTNRTPVISDKLSREIFIAGSVVSLAVFLSTFVPRGVPVNRLAVGLLIVVAILAFAALCKVSERFRSSPWTLVWCAAATVWVSLLVVFTGGPRSDFFPLFFLLLILAGATAEKGRHVAAIATLVCLGYVSHTVFYGEMRDSFRDFLIIRVPVYFTAAYTTYYLVSARVRISEEKNRLIELTGMLDSKAKQMEALFNVSKKIGSKLEVKSVLQIAVHDAVESLEVTASTVHLFGDTTDLLIVASSNGLSKRAVESVNDLRVGEGPAGWVAMAGEPLHVSNTDDDERCHGLRGTHISSLLSVPMTSGLRTIGVLTVYSTSPRSFTDDDIGFLSALAGQAAVAEETAKLHERTEQLSLVDELTSLYNIRKLKMALHDEIKRSKRFGHKFAFVMSDIDYFKHYNDRFGHQEGNEVLRLVARSIISSSRSVDMAFRYGGEEFSLILPETEKHEALEVAERIRKAVESQAIVGEENQPNGRITLSLGIASYPEDASNSVELIKLADRALYEAKHSGRNRVAASLKSAVEAN